MRRVLACLCLLMNCGCDLIGPSCLGRQKRGTVAAFDGEIGAAQTMARVVPYGTEGSQNDVHISWAGQDSPTGPRLTLYATRVDCADFVLPGGPGPCASIGSRGGIMLAGEFVTNSLIVTNGRGNPDVLGVPAEYKLWIVGDPSRRVKYAITITWFYGPDC